MNTTQTLYRIITVLKGVDDPPIAKSLFSDVRWAWIWLLLRLNLAWKTAGWWGLDRWVLSALGTPWRPGYIFHETGQENSSITVKQSSGV